MAILRNPCTGDDPDDDDAGTDTCDACGGHRANCQCGDDEARGVPPPADRDAPVCGTCEGTGMIRHPEQETRDVRFYSLCTACTLHAIDDPDGDEHDGDAPDGAGGDA